MKHTAVQEEKEAELAAWDKQENLASGVIWNSPNSVGQAHTPPASIYTLEELVKGPQ